MVGDGSGAEACGGAGGSVGDTGGGSVGEPPGTGTEGEAPTVMGSNRREAFPAAASIAGLSISVVSTIGPPRAIIHRMGGMKRGRVRGRRGSAIFIRLAGIPWRVGRPMLLEVLMFTPFSFHLRGQDGLPPSAVGRGEHRSGSPWPDRSKRRAHKNPRAHQNKGCGDPGVPPRGFEPLISALKGRRPRPLDDGGVPG